MASSLSTSSDHGRSDSPERNRTSLPPENDLSSDSSGLQTPQEPSAHRSESTSGHRTPSRPKKRVEWILPREDGPGDDGPHETESPDTSAQDLQIRELRRQLTNTLPVQSFNPVPRQSTRRSPPRNQPRSVLRSGTASPRVLHDLDEGVENLDTKLQSASAAQRRAHRVTEDVSRDVSRDASRDTSRNTSRDTSREPSPERSSRRHHKRHSFYSHLFRPSSRQGSGASTPEEYEDYGLGDSDYVPKPKVWRAGGLSALTLAARLHYAPSSHHHHHSRRRSGSPGTWTPRSGSPTRNSISGLVGQSIGLSAIGNTSIRPPLQTHASDETIPGIHSTRRPGISRSTSSSTLLDHVSHLSEKLGFSGHRSPKTQSEIDVAIKKHIQDTRKRHRFLITLSRALMLYGAPTHRLEEYLKITSRVLETEAQFLYLPGCMIISFDDPQTLTGEVRIVRVTQGVDLGKLRDTHDLYKAVVHDQIGVSEASERLGEIMGKKPKYSRLTRILAYGFASAFVGPFAFEARLIDLPMAFILGCVLGVLQLGVAGLTDLYSAVFEVVAIMIISFLSRFFGSFRGGDLFCFPALAQAGISSILPGYTLLCGALELQSKSITAGAVRLVYAVIYSLFIGFGLTMGITVYGALDGNATSAITCENPLSSHGYWVFLFVPLYTICLCVMNFAKYQQMPFMIILAFSGYLTSYFTSKRFVGNPQISSAFASLVIAFVANIHSRAGYRVTNPLERFAKKVYVSFMRKVFPKYSSKMPSIETYDGSDSVVEGQPTEESRPQGFQYFFWRLRHPGQQLPQSAASSRRASEDSSSAPEPKEESGTEQEQRKRPVHVQYGLAAASMLPAIFVLVPSGLSVSGSLALGLTVGDQVTKNENGTILSSSQVLNSTNVSDYESSTLGLSFSVGYDVVQVAVGLTVGLFMGTLLAYPLGKGGKLMGRRATRSGIFSF